ncbi:hypothetical protein, variant [Aphanomyces astaci]|uniref:Uncharacterized protein n=1 Tax=Aphanomyces astaci TaxID=112090 RepID=W4H702_APHAT|nr:hypothetical protein, variant [Aphanomyces astaci]ETV87662.1 hypothetical protein, variant [Aphanomyces astaci]|eukprot:XP_009822525.1 hypothetical protein, variant [Aphanomyces astaci]
MTLIIMCCRLNNPHDPVDDDDLDWQDDPELGSRSNAMAARKRLSPDFNPFSRNQPVPSTPKVVPPLSASPSTPPPSEPRVLPRLHEPINPFAVNHDVFSEFNMVPQVKASAQPPPLILPPPSKRPPTTAFPPPPASHSAIFSMEMDDQAEGDATGWDEDDWTH